VLRLAELIETLQKHSATAQYYALASTLAEIPALLTPRAADAVEDSGMSTEARAESTASTATATAQQAEAARNQAQETAKATTLEAQETKAALNQLVQATDKALAAALGAVPATLGIDEGNGKSAAADATVEWRLALARAKQLTQRQ
jgi:hypothetical protein